MSVRIQLRRDTAANWAAANPVLAAGEPGFETDTRKEKRGNGTTAWNSLGYANDLIGVPPSGDTSGVTDTARLIAAAGSLRRLGQGTFYINTTVDLSGFLGAGSDFSIPLTRIVCVNAGAGVVLQKSGMITGGFCVDGNNVATQPLLVGGSTGPQVNAQSIYIGIDVLSSAQDGWVIQASQNLGVYNCSANNCARDSLVLDYGCGGIVFTRFEGNAHGRYGLRIDETGTAPAGVYTFPTDIQFIGGEFERGAGDFAGIHLVHGTQVVFDNMDVECGVSPYTASAMEILSTFEGSVAISGGLYIADSHNALILVQHNGGLYLYGEPISFGSGAIATPSGCIDNTSNAHISIQSGCRAFTSLPMFKPGTEDGTFVGDEHWGYTLQHPHTTGSIVEAFAVDGDAGQRCRRYGDGTIGWMDGTAFAPDVTLTRSAAGVLQTTGTAWSNRKFTQRSLPTYSASITLDASLAEFFAIVATNGTAFTLNAPTNPPNAAQNQTLTVEIVNSSGGALGAITWNAAFVFAGFTWANPANTKRRNAFFRWNGGSWICQSISLADY